jgi:hypothetical protein
MMMSMFLVHMRVKEVSAILLWCLLHVNRQLRKSRTFQPFVFILIMQIEGYMHVTVDIE